MIASLMVLVLVAGASQRCAFDRAAMLRLPYAAFDETLGAGWRVVGDRPGCEAAGAGLIASYRTANAATLVEGSPDHLRSLDWHEGQLRAAIGQTEAAKALLKRGSRVSDEGGDSLYHAATLAFLEGDRARLLTIRDRIDALPKPEWFEEAAAQARKSGMSVGPWPVHASEVGGLVNCFGKPYREAYSYACRTDRTEGVRSSASPP